MTVKTVTKYQTTDGKEFDDRVDADAHQLELDMEVDVEKFLDIAEITAQRSRSWARNIVIAWTAYQQTTDHHLQETQMMLAEGVGEDNPRTIPDDLESHHRH